MRVAPTIAALRGDCASQRHAQDALERAAQAWRDAPAVAAFLRDMERYGQGAPFADCPSLAALTADLAAARRAIGDLAVRTSRALAAHPLAHVPFRHQLGEGFAVLQLARSGRAMLSLIRYAPPPPAAAAPPYSVCLTDGERHELCLAGRAEARRVTVASGCEARANLAFADLPLAPGAAHAFAGRGETKIVDRIVRPLTLLRLFRQAVAPLPSLEYRLADGALLHRAAGECEESRSELMLALLGRMERRDAVPAMLGLVREGSDSLRWQALRECLALDSAAGFRELARIARDRADPLHAPAAALHADLAARHPGLAQLEREPCPA